MSIPPDRNGKRTLFTRELRYFPQSGVPEKDMHFCGEGTADGDIAADYVRQWYEANREGWYDRATRRPDCADEFILWFMQEVDRVNAERRRQVPSYATWRTRTDARDEPGRIDGEAMSETDEASQACHDECDEEMHGRPECMIRCVRLGPRSEDELITKVEYFYSPNSDEREIAALAREALTSRARIAELERENLALHAAIDCPDTGWRALAEARRAQVETLRSALEPFSYLVDTLKCSRDENSWVMKVEGREPITVADLRRARTALQSLSATEPSR